MAPNLYRRFGGKRFILSYHRGAVPSKARIKKLAEWERSKGRYARIVKWKGAYWIYVRPMNRHQARILDREGFVDL